MSNNHSNHGPGFTAGFFLGALIGAGVVYILGTKKGQEIADEIKEKGLSLVSDFDALLNELGEDAEAPQIAPPVAPTPVQSVPAASPAPIAPNNPEPIMSAMPTSIPVVEAPKESPLMHPMTDVQSPNNYMTVKVEQTVVTPLQTQPSHTPSHIESLQAAGRRFFHGIPKRK